MRLRNPIAVYRQRRLLRDLAPQIDAVERYLADRGRDLADGGPVLFFNASTRIHTLSLNAAFSLLASWAVRAGGVEVRHLVCHSGMRPCVLGTDRRSPGALPPCGPCLDLSRALFPAASVLPLTLDAASAASHHRRLEALSLEALGGWEDGGLPLGAIVQPSVRWILRRHRLPDSQPVRSLFAGYLASAASLARVLRGHLADQQPRALVVFNGIFYPEAVARRVAQDLGIPVVTHEVGLRPRSAFFSHQEATFRQVEIPDGFRLTSGQQAELAAVLDRRFRGDFSMAGIRFWPKIESLPSTLQAKRKSYRQMVSIFTNVIFDTSQVHANVLFSDMFDWLDDLADRIRRTGDTLFVIRAHPDETRAGKESRETVLEWYTASQLSACANVVFIGPEEHVNSYELVGASKLVLVYSSSIGLEASVLGVPVLCAGRARYSDVPVAILPASRSDYHQKLKDLLETTKTEVPADYAENARSFLYREYFQASMDLSEFVSPVPDMPGMVTFRRFAADRLLQSPALAVVRRGILEGRPFVLPGDGLD